MTAVAAAACLQLPNAAPAAADQPLAPSINFIYFSPGRASDSADLAERRARLDEIVNDPRATTTTGGILQERIQKAWAEQELFAARKRSPDWWEPRDGSRYPGSSTLEDFVNRSEQIQQLTEDVLNFYELHTGHRPRATFTPVIGHGSAMSYWLYGRPMSASQVPDYLTFDADPAPQRIFNELYDRDIVSSPNLYRTTPQIDILIADGLGGWAGAMPGHNYGGTAVLGDFVSACAARRDIPDGDGIDGRPTDTASLRQKMPAHIADWVDCSYDGATGGTAHELGHLLGLPHTNAAGCPGPSGALVMSSHWNFRLNGPGFMYDFGFNSDFQGILKRYDKDVCSASDWQWPIEGRNYVDGFNPWVPSGARPIFHSELEVLLANPHIDPAALPPQPPPPTDSVPSLPEPTNELPTMIPETPPPSQGGDNSPKDWQEREDAPTSATPNPVPSPAPTPPHQSIGDPSFAAAVPFRLHLRMRSARGALRVSYQLGRRMRLSRLSLAFPTIPRRTVQSTEPVTARVLTSTHKGTRTQNVAGMLRSGRLELPLRSLGSTNKLELLIRSPSLSRAFATRSCERRQLRARVTNLDGESASAVATPACKK